MFQSLTFMIIINLLDINKSWMYFIFKHAEFSRYKDEKGKVYHFDERSPNFDKVKEGARVLCYQKEDNWIFAVAKVGKILVEEKDGRKEFFALYESFERLEEPLSLDEKVRKKIDLKRNLELPPPGIIPISEETYKKILALIKKNKNI